MKTLYPLFAVATLVLTLLSCAGTRGMQVEVMRPALITISQDIKSIGILNRSIPTAKAGIEGTLSGEMPAQDKDLSEECLRVLTETLNTSNRFVVTRCEGTMNAPDEKSLSFGVPLDWKIVDSLCLKYNLDAILVLEYFDTDFNVVNPGATAAAVVGTVLNGGGTVEVRGTATSNAGFRVYYPKTKSILYEDRFDYKKYWTQRSTNPAEAVAKMIKKNDALFDVSYMTGKEFAMNIVPLFYWENREMYKGKKGEMERGERQALAKDWEGAIKTWTAVYESSLKSKIRAKAAFNIALGYEVMGNLNEAQVWVQRSYVEGGKSTAMEYSNIIDYRLREQNKLKEQTGE
jgi:hypothetical protein